MGVQKVSISTSRKIAKAQMHNRILGRQSGSTIILVAIALPVFLGFGGLVIDLGGLFVAKTELQSALDSCALSAALELDGAADALTRATSAGLTAGNSNKVHYQKSPAGILASEITFSYALAGAYSSTFTPVVNAKYVQCTHTVDGLAAYMIQLVGGPSSNSVGALAIATLGHAQSSCPIPVGISPRAGGKYPDYGYTRGEWVTGLFGAKPEMGWYNLDGSKNANETRDELLNGYCDSKVGDKVGTPGAQLTEDDPWNSRFGIYKNGSLCGDPVTCPPDYTGYAYTSKNWTNPTPQNAYSGTGAVGSDPTAASFGDKRVAFANYADTGTTVAQGDAITGLNMPGGFKNLATFGPMGQHKNDGQNKRIVLIPVVSSSSTIIDYVCMLMLQPITKSTVPVQLEYLGNPATGTTPCSVNGLGGGTAGQLIPVLVK